MKDFMLFKANIDTNYKLNRIYVQFLCYPPSPHDDKVFLFYFMFLCLQLLDVINTNLNSFIRTL